MTSLGGTSSTYWLWMIERTSVNSLRFSYVAAVSLLLLATAPPSESVMRSRSTEIIATFLARRMGLMYASALLLFARPSPAYTVRAVDLATRPQPLRGILRLPCVAHLEVEARPLQRSRVPHRADGLPLLDLVSFRHP